MADLIRGVNAGFVTVAPTANPGTVAATTLNGQSHAYMDTSPSGNYKVTEIGFFCKAGSANGSFDVAIYEDNGDGTAGAVVGSILVDTAKTVGVGWSKVSVDIILSSETSYFIGVSVVSSATTLSWSGPTGTGINGKPGALTDPFNGTYQNGNTIGIYALLEGYDLLEGYATSRMNFKINCRIGGNIR